MNNTLNRLLSIGALALAGVLVSAPVRAQDTSGVDPECVASCRQAQIDCRFDAREAAKQCLEDAGCDTLRDDFRAACLVADRDETACQEARDAYRACIIPCHSALKDDTVACAQTAVDCLTNECGVENLRPPRGHGRLGGFGRVRPHRGQ